MLGLSFLSLLAFVNVENGVVIASARSILGDRLLAAVVIFAHNSLAASTIMVGMSFYANLVALGVFAKRRHANAVLKHLTVFSAVLAPLVVFTSVFHWMNPAQICLEAMLKCVPVAAIESYGIYLAANTALRRSVTAKSLACVYAVFLIGAVVEMDIITFFT
jgi:hypothetical protein